jgi:hypothetical protein
MDRTVKEIISLSVYHSDGKKKARTSRADFNSYYLILFGNSGNKGRINFKACI